METGSRSGLWTMVTLFGPALVLWGFYLLLRELRDATLPMVLLHVATLVWVFFFFRTVPCRVSVLPVSFLLSALGPYLVDKTRPGMFQYLGSMFLLVLYALPWAAVTLVAAVVWLVIQRRK